MPTRLLTENKKSEEQHCQEHSNEGTFLLSLKQIRNDLMLQKIILQNGNPLFCYIKYLLNDLYVCFEYCFTEELKTAFEPVQNFK